MVKHNTQVDVYIHKFAKYEQLQMEELRELIQKVAPSVEGISYNMPSFTWNGKVVACFQMYKNHLGFYPYSGNITKLFKKELAGYIFSDGAVQLPKNKPLPSALIKKMLFARMDEIVKTNIYSYACPKGLGHLQITFDKNGRVTSSIFSDKKTKLLLVGTVKQALDNYFKDKKELPKNLLSKNIAGTGFQKRTWEAIAQTKLGYTLTYTDIANMVGNPKSVRASGTACGKNPVALFIPCHRVVRKQGEDYGYSWGVERKKWLLDFESRS